MRIVGICVCYNEERLLPFFLDYYTSFCDELVIFDGNSTDNSINIIRSYIGTTNCNIELRINHSVGTIDYFDYGHLMDYWNGNWNLSLDYIRSYAWKNLFSKADNDWILVVDVDEFLYHPLGIRNKLSRLKEQNVTLPVIQGFDMISDTYPNYDKSKFLPDIVKSGWWTVVQNKQLIFDAQNISDINYNVGCHSHRAEGLITIDTNTPFIDQIKNLHYKYLGYDNFIERERRKYHNVSVYNKNRGLSWHYEKHMNMTIEDFNHLKTQNTYHEDVLTAISSKKPKS